MSDDSPLFEVTTPAANADARKLTTAARVRGIIGSPSADDTKIGTLIDFVSADCARYCRLAAPVDNASPPTFGQEVVKATWLQTCHDRGTKLILPWRVAISEFGAVTEDGEALTADVDYRHVGAGLLERISDDVPVCWSRGKIVVPYIAGWELPDDVPPELESQVIQQVAMRYRGAARDPALRSSSTERVGSATFAVPGGDSIGDSGLLVSLESALAAFRSHPV